MNFEQFINLIRSERTFSKSLKPNKEHKEKESATTAKKLSKYTPHGHTKVIKYKESIKKDNQHQTNKEQQRKCRVPTTKKYKKSTSTSYQQTTTFPSTILRLQSIVLNNQPSIINTTHMKQFNEFG